MIPSINRREFIAALGGAAAWPLAARAQQGNRVRRIAWLSGGDENDPVQKTYVSAFTQALADLGWADGRNLRMDLRSAGDDINRIGGFDEIPLHRSPTRPVSAASNIDAGPRLNSFVARQRSGVGGTGCVLVRV